MKRLLDPFSILEMLVESPSRIETSTAGLSNAELASRPEENEWSPLEILAHLRACADVWGDTRTVRMLEEEEPTIQAVNPMKWIRETDYDATPFGDSFAAFREQ